jgi:hypothetical protein
LSQCRSGVARPSSPRVGLTPAPAVQGDDRLLMPTPERHAKHQTNLRAIAGRRVVACARCLPYIHDLTTPYPVWCQCQRTEPRCPPPCRYLDAAIPGKLPRTRRRKRKRKRTPRTASHPTARRSRPSTSAPRPRPTRRRCCACPRRPARRRPPQCHARDAPPTPPRRQLPRRLQCPCQCPRPTLRRSPPPAAAPSPAHRPRDGRRLRSLQAMTRAAGRPSATPITRAGRRSSRSSTPARTPSSSTRREACCRPVCSLPAARA